MKNPENISDEYIDSIIKESLEKGLAEELKTLEEEAAGMDEPEYSDEYKRFINGLTRKKIYKTGMERRKRNFLGAALCACLILVLSISTMADIKEAIMNLFVTHDDAGIHIMEYDMNVDYDFNDIPESWSYIYVPEYLPVDFKVQELKSDDNEIDIVFSNDNGDTIKYNIYKNNEMDIINSDYEEVDNYGIDTYYYEIDDTKNIICNLTDFYIKISSNDIEKSEIIQIVKNIKVLGR